ncbi:MAG: acyl-ACP--UDP-N-acetylglucosamine O-acyltransferase [Puniceicoccales bacterium]|jgi:UDP-N-acetylglucosamine acyltransferase|nr:acyl-ACP--UDP-N-acetylglucosamine O-acyltransferase [Puniceicoccales bacterium]
MAISIDSRAIVENGAQLAENVTICAYAYVGKSVYLGEGTRVCHHATVDGRTQIGKNNIIHPYAYIGAPTHDLKYTGGDPGLKIGDGNVFREYCTVHVATKPENETVLGDKNVLLAYAHVAHDCLVGSGVIMSSQAALGGHVVLQDFTNIGWSGGVHQFCKIGKYSMLGAACKVTQDIPPYMLADGNPARVRSPNFVNLQRHGFSEERIRQIKKIFRIFYGNGLNRTQAAELLKSENIAPDLREEFLYFLGESARGFA